MDKTLHFDLKKKKKDFSCQQCTASRNFQCQLVFDKATYQYFPSSYYRISAISSTIMGMRKTDQILQLKLHKQPTAVAILWERGKESQYLKTATHLKLLMTQNTSLVFYLFAVESIFACNINLPVPHLVQSNGRLKSLNWHHKKTKNNPRLFQYQHYAIPFFPYLGRTK